MQHLKNIKKYQAGFTLIETLIAILIFSIALTGLSTIASRGVAGTRGAANAITAQYLMQEGVEAVRHIRDSNYTSRVSGLPVIWSHGIVNVCSLGDECRVSVDFSGAPYAELIDCGGACPALLFDDVTNLYQYDSGNATPFTRTIYVEEVGPNEIEVTSEVKWNEGQAEQMISATELMTHWQNI